MALACPSAEAVAGQLVKLLPRGRAWRTHEGGPEPASTLWRFWRAVAEPFAFLHERLCALRLEFWCATHSETRDVWLAEYGLPDACDPFPDLCTKVAALGGTRCDYYAAVAARAGWSIACLTRQGQCGVAAGGRRAKAGRANPGRRLGPAQMIIRVDLGASPAYAGGRRARARAGRLRAGRPLSCGANIDALKCLIERVVHAEIEVIYAAVPFLVLHPGTADAASAVNASMTADGAVRL